MTEDFPASQLRVEHHILRQVTDMLADLRITGGPSQHRNRPLLGRHQAQDQFDGSGLAGPVMAKQP